MNDYNKLSYDELVQINDELRQLVASLKKEKETYEQCTATVFDPKTMHEQKTKYAVFEKNKTIDILKQNIAKIDMDLKDLKNRYSKIEEENIFLNKKIKELDIVISMAAGYISTSKRFSSTHPMDVRLWLMKGMI